MTTSITSTVIIYYIYFFLNLFKRNEEKLNDYKTILHVPYLCRPEIHFHFV